MVWCPAGLPPLSITGVFPPVVCSLRSRFYKESRCLPCRSSCGLSVLGAACPSSLVPRCGLSVLPAACPSSSSLPLLLVYALAALRSPRSCPRTRSAALSRPFPGLRPGLSSLAPASGRGIFFTCNSENLYICICIQKSTNCLTP